MSNGTAAAYLLGRNERERKRLLLQGTILNPLTERFLRHAGLAPGMRVLDFGCGIGDVALTAARIVGHAGEVIGVDVDSDALEVARLRAREAGYQNITFETADFNVFHPGLRVDAVIARHVLVHSQDPSHVVRNAASFIRPGGIVAFQEYDFTFWPAGYPEVPLAAALQAAIVELFRRSTPHPNIGMRLHHLLVEAGLRDPYTSAECLVGSGPESPFYEWFAETVRSVLPALEKFGWHASVGEIDTLAARLREGFTSARACITAPSIVSACARK